MVLCCVLGMLIQGDEAGNIQKILSWKRIVDSYTEYIQRKYFCCILPWENGSKDNSRAREPVYISISFSCQDLDLRLGAKTRNNDADMSYRRRISLFLLFSQTTH